MTDYVPVVAAILFAALLIATFLLLRRFEHQQRDTRDVIRDMTLDAVFIAIILLMTFIPNLGYISIAVIISFTLMHLPVLLGAALGGPRKGFMLGFLFGLSSYIQALGMTTGLNVLFAHPWVSIPPRVLFGLLAGIVFSVIGKISKNKPKSLYLGLACAGLTVVHTGLVFLDLFVFYPDVIGPLFASGSPVAETTALTFTGIILIGMAGEALIAGVIIPPLYLATSKVLPRFTRKTPRERRPYESQFQETGSKL